MPTKRQRHARIIELIRNHSMSSQQELQERLTAAGVTVTQATLSRDLQELGVLKGRGGYVLPEVPLSATNDSTRLNRALRDEVREIDQGGNLIVIRTDAGHANALAVELDRAQLQGVIGTVAGDDTILLVVKQQAAATKLRQKLRSVAFAE